jgi:hypothetical protein
MQAPLESKFVHPTEFLKLLLSRREMIRSDGSGGKVRGVVDLKTGRRYVVERDKLLRAV